jgi:hypothetical protein
MTTRVVSTLRPNSRPYPYLVIRWIAAVYGAVAIRICRSLPEGPASQELIIIDPEHSEEGPMTRALRRVIVDEARAKSARDRLRMCVVFAEDDCVYIEPSGAFSPGEKAPRGGLRLDDVRPEPK